MHSYIKRLRLIASIQTNNSLHIFDQYKLIPHQFRFIGSFALSLNLWDIYLACALKILTTDTSRNTHSTRFTYLFSLHLSIASFTYIDRVMPLRSSVRCSPRSTVVCVKANPLINHPYVLFARRLQSLSLFEVVICY